MANTSALYVPFDVKIPHKKPTILEGMSEEELDAELAKGIDSFSQGSFSADEIDQALAKEFGIE